ncbi:glutathione peroxidase [Paenibacillus albidus]|uniref:Glutathione peroxidase n=1 Tax=Paenibacillus albidus TaxID=2041023 RepID=A0A917CWV5_9BACL|nr:redoxin domain-containing protein [Paenibacillus albidus]GGG01137.1 glutathione peroxidase [Paenibacillus albidus]
MDFYDFEVTLVDGHRLKLGDYRGKILLIVNTASQCSFSRQLADLQKVYDKRRAQGVEILAFPCNQFNAKEPGSNTEIQNVYKNHLNLTFPLFEKTEVRGAEMHPLFQYLIQQAPFLGFDTESKDGLWMENFTRDKHPKIYLGDGIKWNFSKFLIDREGRVRQRFESTAEPLDIDVAIGSLI